MASVNVAVTAATNRINDAVNYAMGFLHVPYAYGGNGAFVTNLGQRRFGGFDCSGFVIEVLQAFDVVGRGDWTAQGLYWALAHRSSKVESPCTGALVFFGESTDAISHVGLAINGWQMVEAGGGDSRSTSPENSTGFVRVRPIDWRNDLVGVLMPNW